MMCQRYGMSLLAVLVVIGCGGGQPQDAAAKTDRTASPEPAMHLAQAPAQAQPASGGGSAAVNVTVQFEGAAPARTKIKMDADPVCRQQPAAAMESEEVVVNSNGTLKNVFVYVKDGATGTFPTPSTPATLEQSGCWYRPHVFGLQVNQPLDIVNSDATLHNINAKPTTNTPFNIAQPVKGMKTTKKFAKPEVMVKFKCNVHPWMSAYAAVLTHPFFGVSDEQGAAAVIGLPAGTYTLEAWHETYGTQTQTVTVADGETKSVAFTFTAQ
ncbi:MAG: TonB-dependent receptor [Candidatus Omnitrophica bacterium]|nr:TonB-dependent receptor [Candidatus Omnitrophota bacterium]